MLHLDIFGTPIPAPLQKVVKTPKKAVVKKTKEVVYKDTTRVLAHITTTATVKPHSVVVMAKYSKTKAHEKAKDNLVQNKENRNDWYNGYLSPNTKRVITKRLDNWLTSVSSNVDIKNVPKEITRDTIFPTFVTLTLPSKQLHKDETIKNECLIPFIEWLRNDDGELDRKGNLKGCGVECYFWRAETHKNGNIHFHIIIDRYVHWQRIRDKWNKNVEKLGYVTRYRDLQKKIYEDGFVVRPTQLKFEVERLKKIVAKFEETKKIPKKGNIRLLDKLNEIVNYNRLSTTKKAVKITTKDLTAIATDMQQDAYFSAQFDNWNNPNSTDIHAIDKIDSLSAYVVKYMSKDSEEKKLADNQTLMEENGKKYVVTTTLEDGLEFTDTQPYKPVFLVRKVRGRLWGCSDNLRADNVDYPKIELMNEERVHDSNPRNANPFFNRTIYFNDKATAWLDTLEVKNKPRIINDYVKVFGGVGMIANTLPKDLKQVYQIHYTTIFNSLYG